MTALTAICRHCGKPSEEHAHIGNWCLVGDRFSTTQKFSEDLFTELGDSNVADHGNDSKRTGVLLEGNNILE